MLLYYRDTTVSKDRRYHHLPIIELAMYVCITCLRKETPRTADVTVTKIAKSIFSNFWDSYFSSYGEFGEFSLRFTAPLSGRSLSNKVAHHITAKIGDAGCIRLHVCTTPSKSPSWTLDQPGTVSGQRAAYASGPTLRDRRDDEQRGSPYDAKCNVAEIGAVNMGEIGAVRKRSR